MKEQFENSTFDGEEVDFTKPGAATVTLQNLVVLELGDGLKQTEAASFDPEVDAPHRSKGGEEEAGNYRFNKNLTPAKIIKLAKDSLPKETGDQSIEEPRTAPKDGGEAKMDE